MAQNKIKILGVAPYEGMKIMMQRLAAQRSDIDLTVFVGDLNEGVEIAKQNFNNSYDVIISRGGTAEMIGKITSIPLIEISLSVYDILRAIKLAENYLDRYAIVGYSGITTAAQSLCDLLQYKVDIFTIHDVDEVDTTLVKLKKMGYKMVLCDTVTQTTAKRIGLNAILITSGDESIISAFDQAEKFFRSNASIKEDKRFFEDIIRGYEGSILVYDNDKQLVFSSGTVENADKLSLFLKKILAEDDGLDDKKMVKNIDDLLYTITCKIIRNRGNHYVAFYIKSELAPLAKGKHGIKYSNKSEVEDYFFNSFYSVTNPLRDFKDNLDQISLSNAPALIIGEIGTGKSQIARLIYTQSPQSNSPFITIDCELLNSKTWQFLLHHHSSPLNDSGNTLFFKDIHALPSQKIVLLISSIVDMNLHKRNRVIFSFGVDNLNAYPPELISITNQISCLSVTLSPLRDKIEEIPKLSSLYISTVNLNLAKQIIGFDQEALIQLQNYNWPYNYNQFKRCLEEMAVITTTPYISAHTVTQVLAKEKAVTKERCIPITTSKDVLNYEINTNSTLNDLTRDIIALYVEKSNGNYSVAAKKLGISRTTLWRYLK